MIFVLMLRERLIAKCLDDVQVGRQCAPPPRLTISREANVCHTPRLLRDKSTQREEWIVYRDALIVNRAQASSVCNQWGVRFACHSGPLFGITRWALAYLREC